jgi:carnitine O-acetyltransferase
MAQNGSSVAETRNTRSTKTYSKQNGLPRLPIPSLDDTLDRFPKALEALQTPEEQEATKRLVEEFRKGEGPKLQQMLLEYDKSVAPNSYVEVSRSFFFIPFDGLIMYCFQIS